jgi:hypothetical protein
MFPELRSIVAVCAVAVGAAVAQRPLFAPLEEPLHRPGFSVPAIHLCAADFDLDGDVDVLTHQGLFRNDGAGRFAPDTAAAARFEGYSRAVAGDFDGDGDLDAVASRGAAGVDLLLNDGAGGFTLAPLPFASAGGAIALPLSGSAPIVAGDFDGDGMDDLAGEGVGPLGGSGGGVDVLRAVGGGAFADASATLNGLTAVGVRDAADLDGDGDDDLVVAGPGAIDLSVFFAAPSGFVSTGPLVRAVNGALAYARGDFDGDGARDDLVAFGEAPTPPPVGVGPAGDRVLVLTGGAYVAWPLSNVGPHGSLLGYGAADADGDGDDDLVRFKTTGADLCFVSGVSVGAASATYHLRVLPSVGGADAADLDGDGDRDLLARDASGVVRPLFAGLGALRDPAADVLPIAWRNRVLRVADLDGDGADDLWTVVPGAPLVPALHGGLNDGAGGFAAAAVPTGNLWSSASTTPPVVTADFDGDGDEDAFVAQIAGTLSGAVVAGYAYLSDGAGGATVVATPFGAGFGGFVAYTDARSLDIEGDGDVDAVACRANGLDLFVNVGGGNLVRQTLSTSNLFRTCAAADFDGDGDTDVAAAGLSGAGTLFVNVGGVLAPQPLGFTAFATSIAAGDLDLDGDVDLLHGATPLLNGGSAVFSPQPALVSPSGVYDDAHVADFDLDGFPDALYAGALFRGSPAVFGPAETILPYARITGVGDLDRDGDLDLVDATGRIVRNTARQLARGALARPGRTASLTIYGAPNEPVDLVACAGLLPTAVDLGPWGALHVDPATFLFALPIALDASGFAEVGGPVPSSPALVGATLRWQAAFPVPARLSGLVTTLVEGF